MDENKTIEKAAEPQQQKAKYVAPRARIRVKVAVKVLCLSVQREDLRNGGDIDVTF